MAFPFAFRSLFALIIAGFSVYMTIMIIILIHKSIRALDLYIQEKTRGKL